jgi:hypothetical protein
MSVDAASEHTSTDLEIKQLILIIDESWTENTKQVLDQL